MYQFFKARQQIRNPSRVENYDSRIENDESTETSSNTPRLRRQSSRLRYKKFFDDYCTDSDFSDDTEDV